MAPTICLSEVSSKCNPYSRRRHRVQNGGIGKQQRLELRQVNVTPSGTAPLTPPESPVWDPATSNDSCPPVVVSSSTPQNSARVPIDLQKHWKIALAQREGLIDIAVRTMALVRRNNILQEKVNALRAETNKFIRSVLNNPENKNQRERLEEGCKEPEDSTPTENIVTRPPLPPTPDSSSLSSTNDEFYSSSCSDWESDDSYMSSNDES